MKTEFIFQYSTQGTINEPFLSEYNALKNKGGNVEILPSQNANRLVYRGCMMFDKTQYPNDRRFINSWKEYISTSRLSIYYPLIKDLTIPTFFVKKLDEMVIKKAKEYGWKRLFIKNDIKSLWSIDEYASVWPDHSFDEIYNGFKKWNYVDEAYAIRAFVEPKIFINEERYWVMNDKIYHRNDNIPAIIKEAVARLSVLGSHYYTIDATQDFIVEVNPGESSDRGGPNSADLFASWLIDAFDR